MKTIIIKSQDEFDQLPDRFDEFTYIEIGATARISIDMARGNSSVEARENSSVVAWGNSSVVAWENSSVEARGNSVVRIVSAIGKLALHGFSVLFIPFNLKFNFTYQKTCCVQKFALLPYLEREGVPVTEDGVILFKRVSNDFKTREGIENETLWTVGKNIAHPSWEPARSECGTNKFHACSRPYFCDEFRNEKNDRYIAIKIKTTDLYEWPNPRYTHKIAFRRGKVLYECDRFGRRKKL